MNWKRDLQLRDLEPGERLEATCRICKHTYYLHVDELHAREEFQFIWLDELEKMSVCKARGCSGPVRLAKTHQGEVEGFVGGLA